jgi:excisionase family DNA binding protein
MIRMNEKRIPRNDAGGLGADRRFQKGPAPRRWITVGEIASLLSLHPMSVRKMIARGEIGAVRIGRAVRVDLRELERQLEHQIQENRR